MGFSSWKGWLDVGCGIGLRVFPLVSTLDLGLSALLELESSRSPAAYWRTAREWNILISQPVSNLRLGLACSLPSAIGMAHR